jgi:UDP-N-acetylglucosamine 2-epimerase (non-hydrolysing)/GDP/UDP-N,N'-diacetylbacillosamine 2-epimerase (hydrolysing)
VVGNSSSGIIEAPSLGVPTVNIGLRQLGRVRAASVVDCPAHAEAIVEAIGMVLRPEFQRLAQNVRNPYERLGTSDRIVDVLRAFNPSEAGPKMFFDLPDPETPAVDLSAS